PVHETAFGNDALNPVTDSDIVRVLRSQTAAPVTPVRLRDTAGLAPGVIYVCDGESDFDVAEAARRITGSCRLAAGPAALAEAIARTSQLPRVVVSPLPRIASCLVINGSLHERSRAQVCEALRRGWPIAAPGAIPTSEWVILGRNGTDMGPVIRG